jgi:hypothetical protein
MAFTWALSDLHWDIQIKNGKLQTVYGVDEIKQRILVTLWHYWEEYFLNVPAGVPWYELILGSKNQKMVASLLKNEILSVPGVVGILNFQILAPIGYMRDFSIYADVEVYGGTAISVNVNQPLIDYANFLTTETGSRLITDTGDYLKA